MTVTLFSDKGRLSITEATYIGGGIGALIAILIIFLLAIAVKR